MPAGSQTGRKLRRRDAAFPASRRGRCTCSSRSCCPGRQRAHASCTRRWRASSPSIRAGTSDKERSPSDDIRGHPDRRRDRRGDADAGRAGTRLLGGAARSSYASRPACSPAHRRDGRDGPVALCERTARARASPGGARARLRRRRGARCAGGRPDRRGAAAARAPEGGWRGLGEAGGASAKPPRDRHRSGLLPLTAFTTAGLAASGRATYSHFTLHSQEHVMLRKLAIAGMLAAAGTAAFAQANTPGVDQRQVNQERRIEQGERSGALTAREAHRLEAGQARVGRMEDRAKSDGVVTARERARLHQAQDVRARIARRSTIASADAEPPSQPTVAGGAAALLRSHGSTSSCQRAGERTSRAPAAMHAERQRRRNSPRPALRTLAPREPAHRHRHRIEQRDGSPLSESAVATQSPAASPTTATTRRALAARERQLRPAWRPRRATRPGSGTEAAHFAALRECVGEAREVVARQVVEQR